MSSSSYLLFLPGIAATEVVHISFFLKNDAMASISARKGSFSATHTRTQPPQRADGESWLRKSRGPGRTIAEGFDAGELGDVVPVRAAGLHADLRGRIPRPTTGSCPFSRVPLCFLRDFLHKLERPARKRLIDGWTVLLGIPEPELLFRGSAYVSYYSNLRVHVSRPPRDPTDPEPLFRAHNHICRTKFGRRQLAIPIYRAKF